MEVNYITCNAMLFAEFSLFAPNVNSNVDLNIWNARLGMDR